VGEFELIRRYFAAAACARGGEGIALGIGDDCALLAPGPGEQLAVSTDSLVAGVHFPDPCDPCLLGQRALAVAASDLAAMGAAPLGFTLALSLPQADEAWLRGFAEGLDAMAARCGLALVGGDTTRGPLSLTLTVFGRLPAGTALRRDAARVGELLCVGGSLGDAAGALPLVLGERHDAGPQADALLAHYWAPPPQFALGLALRGRAGAALDISDGLLADAGHIAEASAVALQIERERLPLSAALREVQGDAAAGLALSGGDDYRLLFTLDERHLQSVRAAFPEVCVIGRVLPGDGVHVSGPDGQALRVPRRGYQHFGSPS